MFSRVSALAVYVTDLEQATRFYTEALEFKVRVAVSPTLCFLHSPAGDIEIYLKGGHAPNPAHEDNARLGFFIRSTEAVFATFEKLKERRVDLLQEGPEEVGKNTYTFQFKDPDANIIAVVGER